MLKSLLRISSLESSILSLEASEASLTAKLFASGASWAAEAAGTARTAESSRATESSWASWTSWTSWTTVTSSKNVSDEEKDRNLLWIGGRQVPDLFKLLLSGQISIVENRLNGRLNLGQVGDDPGDISADLLFHLGLFGDVGVVLGREGVGSSPGVQLSLLLVDSEGLVEDNVEVALRHSFGDISQECWWWWAWWAAVVASGTATPAESAECDRDREDGEEEETFGNHLESCDY